MFLVSVRMRTVEEVVFESVTLAYLPSAKEIASKGYNSANSGDMWKYAVRRSSNVAPS